MSENKEIEKLTGYHRESEDGCFYLCGKKPDCSQLTEERLKALLDACDHSEKARMLRKRLPKTCVNCEKNLSRARKNIAKFCTSCKNSMMQR